MLSGRVITLQSTASSKRLTPRHEAMAWEAALANNHHLAIKIHGLPDPDGNVNGLYTRMFDGDGPGERPEGGAPLYKNAATGSWMYFVDATGLWVLSYEDKMVTRSADCFAGSWVEAPAGTLPHETQMPWRVFIAGAWVEVQGPAFQVIPIY